jgi:hypothetical protein
MCHVQNSSAYRALLQSQASLPEEEQSTARRGFEAERRRLRSRMLGTGRSSPPWRALIQDAMQALCTHTHISRARTNPHLHGRTDGRTDGHTHTHTCRTRGRTAPRPAHTGGQYREHIRNRRYSTGGVQDGRHSRDHVRVGAFRRPSVVALPRVGHPYSKPHVNT